MQAFSMIDWAATRAYHSAEFNGSIRVNLKGREKNGIVEPGAQYETLCEAIRRGLEAYVDPDTGKRVVERVFRREELYWGPCTDTAPDLILHLADYAYTFDWHIPLTGRSVPGDRPVVVALNSECSVNCGDHRLSGILMLNGADIPKGVSLDLAQIYDIVPTVLYLLGLPIPLGMDGQVLTKAVNGSLLARRPIELGGLPSSVAQAAISKEAYSEAEAEAVARRLRDLGYL
jgi:predicted AlkP superfamily phosphohydrolase/phosphomutase